MSYWLLGSEEDEPEKNLRRRRYGSKPNNE
jgi:hypothetical protein